MIRSPSGRLNLVIISCICVAGAVTYDAIRASKFLSAALQVSRSGPAVTLCKSDPGGAAKFAVWEERGWKP